ncbi:hypothetical protein OV760_28030, partial [Salmonella enterica subsp. enterica serovar 1,4,[5],12:i:-]|nr:hypothetical protein [Salmonella enterica subsp. enterica serovar 1,4,[5],12:i:-]
MTGTAAVEYMMEHPEATGGNPEEAEQAKFIVHIVIGVLIVLFLAAFLIDLFLLIGVYKRNYCLMMPYLIFSGIGNSFLVLGCV